MKGQKSAFTTPQCPSAKTIDAAGIGKNGIRIARLRKKRGEVSTKTLEKLKTHEENDT